MKTEVAILWVLKQHLHCLPKTIICVKSFCNCLGLIDVLIVTTVVRKRPWLILSTELFIEAFASEGRGFRQ